MKTTGVVSFYCIVYCVIEFSLVLILSFWPGSPSGICPILHHTHVWIREIVDIAYQWNAKPFGFWIDEIIISSYSKRLRVLSVNFEFFCRDQLRESWVTNSVLLGVWGDAPIFVVVSTFFYFNTVYLKCQNKQTSWNLLAFIFC